MPVAAVLVLFLVANRQMVPVSFNPFSTGSLALSLPLWAWLMAMLLIGYFLGAVTLWISGRDKRRQASLERKELKALRKELEIVQATKTPESGDNLPVLEAS